MNRLSRTGVGLAIVLVVAVIAGTGCARKSERTSETPAAPSSLQTGGNETGPFRIETVPGRRPWETTRSS
jgi:hypothetical protein